MLTVNRLVIKSPDTVSRIIDQEAVIIQPALGELKVLNAIGARIWELADGTRTISDLVDCICDEYTVLREQAEKDALDFVQQLIDKKMLVIVEENQ